MDAASLNDDVLTAAADAYGALWSVLPTGFLGARMALEPNADGLRVTDLRAALTEKTEPPPRPVSPEYQVALLGLKLAELRESLADIDVPWSGAFVVCDRTDEQVRLLLIDADESEESSEPEEAACEVILRPQDLDRCIFTDTVFEAILARGEAWRDRQRAFEEEVGAPDGIQLTLAQRLCRFEYKDRPAIEKAVRLLGSYAREHGNWQWAWANTSFPAAAYEGLTAFRDRADEQAGMAAMTRPGFDCHPDFASALAALAADDLGAVAVMHVVEEGGRTALVAVLPAA